MKVVGSSEISALEAFMESGADPLAKSAAQRYNLSPRADENIETSESTAGNGDASSRRHMSAYERRHKKMPVSLFFSNPLGTSALCLKIAWF